MPVPASGPTGKEVASNEEDEYEYEESMDCCQNDFDHICTMIGVVATVLNLVVMMAVYIYFIYTDDDETKKAPKFSGWIP